MALPLAVVALLAFVVSIARVARAAATVLDIPLMRGAKQRIVLCPVMALAFAANAALALPGTFKIDEIYSNADGTVQFIVIHDNGGIDCDSGEDRWAGQVLTSSGPDPKKTFVFPNDLPTCQTSGRDILIATQGFGALGLVAPDYLIPDGFVQTPSGTVNFAGVSELSYASLPNDGIHAINRFGTPVQNLATNLAGATASVSPAGPTAANYQGIWWNAPANSESGWGLNLAHQGDIVFASWFTYDTSGKGWWLVATMNKTGTNTYSGDLYTAAGSRFDAFNPANVTPTKAGTATLTFTDANNGSFNYVIGAVNQTKTVTRQVFGTLPSCSFGTVADLTTATNYQDLWWNKPANSESGWGINLNHQGDTIFATWFTYDVDGSPLWLVVSASKTPAGTYSGDLYRTSGGRFDAFNPASVTNAKVGTATFTFADGNDATFDYTVQLAGMAAPIHQQKQITREIFTAPGTTCQ